MSMTIGVDVVIDDNGTLTAGTGAKLEVYTALAATIALEPLPVLGATAPPYSAERPVLQNDIDLVKAGRVRTLREQARLANAVAALLTHLVTNGKAKVKTTDAGIQRMPASTAEDTACKAPATDKFLDIV